MMKSKIIAAAALLIALSCAAAWAEPFIPTDRIMPISQVRPGMRGHCVTVVRGTVPVTFPVEVIDIIEELGAPKKLILIRAYGPVIKETGGIAAGMSGSPLYINGRLAGAIGYGWPFSGHDLGLATSVDDLLNVWNNPERVPSFKPAPIIPDEPTDSAPQDGGFVISDDAPPAEERPAVSDDVITVEGFGEFVKLSPPISVSGVSPRVAELIGGALGKSVVPFGGGSEGGSKRARYGAALKPGAAIGASLVWGDVEVSAIGTLSAAARDGRFIAFAHPFVGMGYTSAALTEARISRVVPSQETPFKLGTTQDLVGIITQDRPEGIGGRMGQFAPAASCTIKFHDVDADRRQRRRFQTVMDPFVISKLMTLASRGSIEDMWARSGGGSARVVAKFSGGALRGGWSRSNIFVSEENVVEEMMKEFSDLTSIFSLNQFQELRPFGVELDIEMTVEPRVVYIDDVKVPDGPFAPGQTVSFDITLRPWRKPPITRTYSLVVPQKVDGICELMVRGGGIAEETAEYMEARWRSISSLPILLRELDAKESNDQIVLEIRGQEALDAMMKQAQKGDVNDLMNDKLKSELREEKEKEGSMRVIRTNYYVDGMIQKLIRVDSSASDKGDNGDDDDDEEEKEEE